MNALITSKDFIFKGSVWKNCGASAGQETALAQDQSFSKMMGADYSQNFAQNQQLFNNLNTNLGKITSAGVGQQGYTAPELTSMNSQAINAAAASNQKTQAAIGEQNAGKSNATPGIESGVESAERASAATQADTALNNQEAGITQQNYATGRQNYWQAMGEQAKLPGEIQAPEAEFANAATGSNQTTDTQANANEAANNAWQGLVTGLAGDAATAFGGKKGG